jgi:hypothetical protein
MKRLFGKEGGGMSLATVILSGVPAVIFTIRDKLDKPIVSASFDADLLRELRDRIDKAIAWAESDEPRQVHH